jgi:1,4-dihydroxy-6-naphthoate synthase
MNSETIHLGLSPCPNDTFICDALLHGKIDTEGLQFEPVFDDVESLNNRAFLGELDVTKVSFHAFLYLLRTYQLLDAGAALGRGCGPLLIGKKAFNADEIPSLNIAIPGQYTTANLLLSLAFPTAINKTMMVFSEIENAIIQDQCDAGVIIHENRFTYQDHGLICHCDLGEIWEQQYNLPIPLGGFVVNKLIDPEKLQSINRVMRRSVEYALKNPTASSGFVAKYAQEMDLIVRNAHIDLYVGSFTKSLGTEGRKAVEALYHAASGAGIVLPEVQTFSSCFL